MIELSVIIPLYNAAFSIKNLVEKVQNALQKHVLEIILVNDGSIDNTLAICKEIAANHSNVSFISLRKNFGEFNAVMCGLNYARGTYSVIIDDDFQNPPTEIWKLVESAKQKDFDVVYSYYDKKKHSLIRNLGSDLVNFLTTFLLKKPKDLYLSSFKLIHKDIVNEIIKYRGPYPYIDGLIFRVTNNVGKVLVEHNKRDQGSSNYTFRKLISLFLTIMFGYSLIPIRLTLFAGVASVLSSLLFIFFYHVGIIGTYFSPLIIFLCGFILCAIAVMGEIIGKNYMTINGTPQYVIKEKIIKDAV